MGYESAYLERNREWEENITGDTSDSQDPKRTHWQFPADLGQGDGDLFHWMLITAYEITGGWENTKVVKFGNPSGSIALPIPPGLSAQYGQNWSQQDVGMGTGMAARLGGGVGITDSIRGFMGKLGVTGDNNLQANEFSTTNTPVKGVEEAQEGVGAALKAIGLADVTQMQTGVRVLNQVMLSYGGPIFREFNFAFSLKPNNEKDSEHVDSLIRWLKFKSAPGQNVARFIRVFRLPSVFRIQFYSGPGAIENERIPKIGYCVLKNIGTQYGGDIFRTFDRDSKGNYSPVQVNLSMTFQEMEFLDRSNFITGPREGTGIQGDF